MNLSKDSLFLIAVAAAAAPVIAPALAQDGRVQTAQTQQYQCTALERAGGHEEPSLTSPPMRMTDGRLRILEENQKAYASWASDGTPGWIALYSSSEGGADAFLGHFPSESFKCEAVEG